MNIVKLNTHKPSKHTHTQLSKYSGHGADETNVYCRDLVMRM